MSALTTDEYSAMLEEPAALTPDFVLIARVLADSISLNRTIVEDSQGTITELHNAAPPAMPQLHKVLAYVQARLAGQHGSTHDWDFRLQYIQASLIPDDRGCLSMGYQLDFTPYRHAWADAQGIEEFRGVACEAAKDLLLGRLQGSREDCAPDEDMKQAIRLHESLLGQVIQQPFTFSCPGYDDIQFEGQFPGREEENDDGVVETIHGYINHVTCRGKTLSFICEELPDPPSGRKTRRHTIEFNPPQYFTVHSHIKNRDDAFEIEYKNRVTTLSTGKLSRTKSLCSIGPSSEPLYSARPYELDTTPEFDSPPQN